MHKLLSDFASHGIVVIVIPLSGALLSRMKKRMKTISQAFFLGK